MPDLDLRRTFSDQAIVNPVTHHERSDVNVRALLWFIGIFIAFAFVTHFLVWMLFKFFAGIERGNVRPPRTQIARPAGAGVPAEPRLQPFETRDAKGLVNPPNANTPMTDMEAMLARQNGQLSSYGWVDRQKGLVHIPIAEAKKMALTRGFAVNPGGTLPPATVTAEGQR